METCGEQE
jgi:hypothetical protein